jgi:hypothetical protein
MDAITLAQITAAVTVLGTKVAEGVASAAGKSVWANIVGLFGWKDDPPSADLAKRTAEHLHQTPQDAPLILQLLEHDDGTARMLVGKIDAKNVAVAQKIDTLNMS